MITPFLAGMLTLKTVLQRAPEHTFFIQKLAKFSKAGRGPYLDPSPSGTHPAFVNAIAQPIVTTR